MRKTCKRRMVVGGNTKVINDYGINKIHSGSETFRKIQNGWELRSGTSIRQNWGKMVLLCKAQNIFDIVTGINTTFRPFTNLDIANTLDNNKNTSIVITNVDNKITVRFQDQVGNTPSKLILSRDEDGDCPPNVTQCARKCNQPNNCFITYSVELHRFAEIAIDDGLQTTENVTKSGLLGGKRTGRQTRRRRRSIRK